MVLGYGWEEFIRYQIISHAQDDFEIEIIAFLGKAQLQIWQHNITSASSHTDDLGSTMAWKVPMPLLCDFMVDGKLA